jgi:hypothetical protein
MDQRHIAAASIDQALQIGIAPMATGHAPHQDTHIAAAQRGSRGSRQSSVAASPRDLIRTACGPPRRATKRRVARKKTGRVII